MLSQAAMTRSLQVATKALEPPTKVRLGGVGADTECTRNVRDRQPAAVAQSQRCLLHGGQLVERRLQAPQRLPARQDLVGCDAWFPVLLPQPVDQAAQSAAPPDTQAQIAQNAMKPALERSRVAQACLLLDHARERLLHAVLGFRPIAHHRARDAKAAAHAVV